MIKQYRDIKFDSQADRKKKQRPIYSFTLPEQKKRSLDCMDMICEYIQLEDKSVYESSIRGFIDHVVSKIPEDETLEGFQRYVGQQGSKFD